MLESRIREPRFHFFGVWLPKFREQQKARHPGAAGERCVLSSHWSISDAPFMCMYTDISDRRKFKQLWGLQLTIRHHRKNHDQKAFPLSFPLQHGITESILQCMVRFRHFVWKICKNSKIEVLWCPVAPKSYVIQKTHPRRVTPWPLFYIAQWLVSLYNAVWAVGLGQPGHTAVTVTAL